MSLLKAAGTSAVLMSAGDVICQTIQARKPVAEAIRTLDSKRTGVFGFIGLTLHGPFFYKGFKWIDHVYGSQKSLSVALRKTAFGQVTIFPVYLAAFFMYSSLLEGKNVNSAVEKTKSKFLHSYAVGTVFWPIVNVFNFAYVPPQGRVLYVGVSGIIWNAFLSWQNSIRAEQSK